MEEVSDSDTALGMIFIIVLPITIVILVVILITKTRQKNKEMKTAEVRFDKQKKHLAKWNNPLQNLLNKNLVQNQSIQKMNPFSVRIVEIN